MIGTLLAVVIVYLIVRARHSRWSCWPALIYAAV